MFISGRHIRAAENCSSNDSQLSSNTQNKTVPQSDEQRELIQSLREF